MAHKLTVEKRTQRQLNPLVIRKQLTHVVRRALGGKRQKQGWHLGRTLRAPAPIKSDDGWLYRTVLVFERNTLRINTDTVQRQFAFLTKIAGIAANSRGWNIPDAGEVLPRHPLTAPATKCCVPLTLPGTVDAHFKDIYDRREQIGIVTQAIHAAVQSGFQNRNHCVLFGPPACGKSEILLAFKKMLGADAVLQFDATSTTEAGARRELRELANIPPILICEEIEKTDDRSLRWLLGVLDTRGEIRGVNYRDANFQRDVKLLCLATVNDMRRFKEVMSGALASRFANKIRCPRPSREVLDKILQREVQKLNGNPDWIKPALDYCLNIEKTDDPRRAIAVTLCGQDKLLTGEYQKWLEATREINDSQADIRA